MREYHKINSIFKRDRETNKFIDNDYSLPEFEYLKDLEWIWTEKVDGTNIRVGWNGVDTVTFKGRTDRANLPGHLLEELTKMFPKELFISKGFDKDITLYGEGYGYKIQKGSKYLGDKVSFVLFDVFCGMWLQRETIEEIAKVLNIHIVPVVGKGTVKEAIEFVKQGLESSWKNYETFEAEGLVIRPSVELNTRRGARIITKIKCRDFR